MRNRRAAIDSRLVRGLAFTLLAACVCMLAAAGCGKPARYSIAVIPRTTATVHWESLHTGVEHAAYPLGIKIYWNAPTREDDIHGQVALIDRLAAGGNYQGLVIAPDQSLALISPVRRALAKGLSIVILGSPLRMPPGGNLYYVLSDDEEGGRMAARRVAAILRGKGTVALSGVNPDIQGTMLRARGFEQLLADKYPEIHVVDKRDGSFNVPHEQQVSEEMLKKDSDLDVIVALSLPATEGVLATIGGNPRYASVKVIGFDPDPVDFSSPNLDSSILQNMPGMGRRAIDLLHDQREGKRVPSQIEVEPMLVTRDNANSAQVAQWTSTEFRVEPHTRWGSR